MKFSPLVLSTAALSAASWIPAATASPQSKELVSDLVSWVRGQKGAYFSDKQEIRRDENGEHDGIYATELIQKGEVLFTMPWEAIITAFGEGATPAKDPQSIPLNCDLVRNVILEIEKGKDSTYHKYVQYLMDLPEGELPSSWSEPGGDLLAEILGDLPPTDVFSWLEDDWFDVCRGGDTPLEQKVALMVVQNADDDLMIPLFDMYNHRNKPWHNVDGEAIRGVKYDLVATQTIEAGQQIHTSYNLCAGCGGRNTIYGSPEIFRDYGFIEKYPQRWTFHSRKVRLDLDKADDSSDFDITFFDLKEEKYVKKLDEDDVEFMRREIQRLERIGNLEWANAHDDIPEVEKKLAWEYHAAILNAMKSAVIASYNGNVEKACLDGRISDGECLVGDTYDDFVIDKDPINYSINSCNIAKLMEFEGYDLTFVRKTHYQTMNYQTRRSDKNVCMDLDDTVQICSNYRPHYHEYIVDYPARYIENVKRVIFIGGGDSMILHEVLKYPELELVVGLEIDQQVTRHVFKRMHTQPHFEDDRVEWWFGDATKSLLLLPEDYNQSFDLVLVDLSETVVSLTVTDELDVLEALSLFLKPDGVMVKNEFYHNKMAEVFDYTAEVHVNDVPVICAQSMILGSNSRDFFHNIPKDREMEMMLIDPIEKDMDRLNLIHDYRQNNATLQGKCKQRSRPELTEQTKAAGQLMVIDAEDCTLDLSSLSSIKEAVEKTAADVGFRLVDSAIKESVAGNAFIVTMQEGYIMARVWADSKYIAFDAHLWGAFSKYEALRSALIKLAGSPKGSYPTYRIVVGGMFGYPDWKEDQSTMGPRPDVTSRNCDTSTGIVLGSGGVGADGAVDDTDAAAAAGTIEKSAIDAVLGHTIEKMVWSEDGVAVVLCGAEGEACTSRDVMSGREEVAKVVVVNTCEGLDLDGPIEVRSASMYKCERAMTKKLLEEVGASKVTAIVVDNAATIETAKIVYSIFESPMNRKALLYNQYVAISFMTDESEVWKRGLLERLRRHDPSDPSARVEIILNQGDVHVELGILSLKDSEFILHLGDLIDTMEEQAGLTAKVKKVQGGRWEWQKDYNPREYLPEEYNPAEAIKQSEEQKPLGRQSVFQMELSAASAPLTAEGLAASLSSTLSSVGIETDKIIPQIYEGSEGCVLAALYDSGSVVVVWDGRKHADMNLFSYDEDEEKSTNFVEVFQKVSGGLGLTLRDDQPRGTGRVVNFQADIDHVDEPIVTDDGADNGDDDDKDDDDDDDEESDSD